MQKPWLSQSTSQQVKPETYAKNLQEFIIFVEQVRLIPVPNLNRKAMFFLHKLDNIAQYAQQILHQESILLAHGPHIFSEVVFLLNYIIETEKDTTENREMVDFLLRYKAGISTTLLFSSKYDSQLDLKDPQHLITIREAGKQSYSFHYQLQEKSKQKQQQQQQKDQPQQNKQQTYDRYFLCPDLMKNEELPLLQLEEANFPYEVHRLLQMRVSLQRDVCEVLEAVENFSLNTSNNNNNQQQQQVQSQQQQQQPETQQQQQQQSEQPQKQQQSEPEEKKKDPVKVVLQLLYCDKDRRELINDVVPQFLHMRAQICNVSVPEMRRTVYLSQSDALVVATEWEHCTMFEMIRERSAKEGQTADKGRAWPKKQLRNIFSTLLQELIKLHKNAQIAHRDLRPQTVVYLRRTHKVGFKDFSKAFYFGTVAASQDIQQQQQIRKRIYGTLDYLSPQLEKFLQEKKESDNIDLEKADLYALGLTFYQMLNLKTSLNRKEVAAWIEDTKKSGNVKDNSVEQIIINLLEEDQAKRGSLVEQFIAESNVQQQLQPNQGNEEDKDSIDDKDLFKPISEKQKKKKKKQTEEEQLELSKLLAEIGLNKRREEILKQLLQNIEANEQKELAQQNEKQQQQGEQQKQVKDDKKQISNQEEEDKENKKQKKSKKNKKSNQEDQQQADQKDDQQSKQHANEDPTLLKKEFKSMVLVELAKAVSNDHNQIYSYYKKALELKINQQFIVNYVKMEGDFLFQEGNHEEALKFYNLCYDSLDEKDQNYFIKKQQLLSCLGSSSLGLEKPDFAMKYFQESQTLLEKNVGKNNQDYAIGLQNIGECYYKMNKLDEALDFYKQALVILQNDKKVDQEKIARAMSNIGEVYRSKNEIDTALLNFENALKLMENKFGKKSYYICPILNNLGIAHQQLQQPQKGLDYLQRVIEIEEAAGLQETYEHSQTLLNICILFKDLKKKEEAKASGVKAYQILLHLLTPEHPLVQKCVEVLNLVEAM